MKNSSSGGDPATLLDTVLACRRIERFLHEVSEREFHDDDEKHWAVVSQLSIIGEAVRRLSPAFRESRSEIGWKRIAGMRDRLIHAYDQIDWSVVWKTASEDVPALCNMVEPLLPAP